MSAPSERPMVLVMSATMSSPRRAPSGDRTRVAGSRLPGQGPLEGRRELVAPIVPMVAVARLHEAHLSALLAEESRERPVLLDEPLVDAATHEDAQRQPRRIRADQVEKIGDTFEQRVAGSKQA